MQDITTWQIHGLSLFVDVEDAAFMERYQAAMAAIVEPTETVETEAEAIRAYCKNYRIFFDALFGEGTSEQLFADIPDNRNAYDTIFLQLADLLLEQRIANALRKTEAVKSYAPKG